MKIWYKAVCDECGEATDVMVSNPNCTNNYLSSKNKEIQAWLSKHYNCNLRLIWRDQDLDALWEQGYKRQEINGLNILVRDKTEFEKYKESLIKTIKWYRDEYHKKDFGHTEMIERIKETKDAKELEVFEQTLDGWLDS